MKKKFALLLTALFLATPLTTYASELSSGWYTITGTNPLYRIASESEGVQIQYATNKANQKFQIVRLSDGLYRIGTGNSAGMQVLTVNDDNITQSRYNKTDNQKWIITETKNGRYIIQNADKYLSYSSLKNKTFLSLLDEAKEFIITPFTEKFTVTFKDGEETVARKSVIKGKSVEYSLPNKEGMAFEGWDVELDNIQDNIVANAVWREAVTYKVTFMDGDEVLSDTYVEEGAKAQAPDISEREGKEFVGWDAEFDNITEDIVINAIWQDKAHEHDWQPVYRTIHHEEVTHEEEYEEEYTYMATVNGWKVYYRPENGERVELGRFTNRDEAIAYYQSLYTQEAELNKSGQNKYCVLYAPTCFNYANASWQEEKTDYEIKTRTVVDQEAYDEQVLDHYECSCGEIRE